MTTLHETMRTSGPTTKLEQALGFESLPFRSYIRMFRVSDKSSGMLTGLSDAMAEDSHPVVLAAAGWAAAEAGLFRGKKEEKGISFIPRLNALERAQSLWESALPLFDPVIRRTRSSRVAAELLGIELRTRQAIAYLPSMELAAYWLNGLKVHEDTLKRVIMETGKNLLTFAADLDKLNGKGSEFNKTRGGMCTELLSGALINEDRSMRSLIVPASIRQDNNFRAESRADLIAISTEQPYRKTRIQITSEEELMSKDGERVVIYDKDLLPSDVKYPRTLLKIFIDKNKGVPVSPTHHAWLNMLSYDLASQIDVFDIRRMEQNKRGD